MTEGQWDACTDPDEMLEALRASGLASDRKLRLFAISCLARIRHLFRHENANSSLEVAERFAEGKATAEELRAAEEIAMWAGDDLSWNSMEKATATWAAA